MSVLCLLGGMVMLPTAYDEYMRKKEKAGMLLKRESEEINTRKQSGKGTEITLINNNNL